jgi:LmbE family N-acetylglucosaminyl deacetylase
MKKILVIVAHPDDELIWMGGTLLRHKDKRDWNTTVLCLTRKSDSDRNPKFFKVAKELGVEAHIYDFDDTTSEPWNPSEVIKIIKKFSNKVYDIVFTHGKNGEYGHPHHKLINKIINKLVEDNILKTKSLMNFDYFKRKNNYQGYCIPNLSTNKFIKLKSQELIIKKHLIKNVYGYQEGGFEEKSCNQIESFKKIK